MDASTLRNASNLHLELLEALESWGVPLAPGDCGAPLISSGLLDSVALFSLSLWVEERTGRPLDPTSFDLASEWDTVDRIVAFVERTRSGGAAPAAPEAPAAPAAPAVEARPQPRRTAEGYEIVRYVPDLKDAVVSLQRRLWSSRETLNRRFFEWRYEESPFAGEPLIYLAFKDGVPVGMRAFCGSLWQAGAGEPPRSWYFADDLVVLPGHESRGLFASFTEIARADLAARGERFFLSLSALRVTRLQSLTGGARSVGTMKPVGYRPGTIATLDGLRQVAARLPAAWRIADYRTPAESARRTFAAMDAAAPRVAGACTLTVAAAARAADMAALVERLGHDGRFRHVRNEPYFAWRYLNPLHEYRFVYADDADGLAGYLVLERGLSDSANPRRVNIADWEGRSSEVRALLLRHALECGQPAELVTWTETLGEDRVACLRDHGFRPTDAEQTARGLPCVLVWPVDPAAGDEALQAGGRSLLDIANWDLRMAYTSLA